MEKDLTKNAKAAFSLEEVIFEELNLKRLPREQGKFDLSITPFGKFFRNSQKFQLNLIIELKDENETFDLLLNTVGIFRIDGENSLDKENPMFYINAPAILFPYIRAHISAITSLSGLKPVNLPVMNLMFLKEELIENTTYGD